MISIWKNQIQIFAILIEKQIELYLLKDTESTALLLSSKTSQTSWGVNAHLRI